MKLIITNLLFTHQTVILFGSTQIVGHRLKREDEAKWTKRGDMNRTSTGRKGNRILASTCN
jgi:hypothetical protein